MRFPGREDAALLSSGVVGGEEGEEEREMGVSVHEALPKADIGFTREFRCLPKAF